MNVNHVHQDDENSYNKCSHPACNVTKERLKKYCLLRSKEIKVLEKYDKAARLHDTIAKRRQSISHFYSPVVNNNQLLHVDDALSRQRRYSIPNKRKMSYNNFNRSASPHGLNTLNETLLMVEPNNFDTRYMSPRLRTRKISVTPNPQGSSPISMRRKISTSLTNLHRINVDELNNSLQLLHEEADMYLESSRSGSMGEFNSMNDQPYWQRHYLETSSSIDELEDSFGIQNGWNTSLTENTTRRKESEHEYTVNESLNVRRRHRIKGPEHMAAEKKLTNRRSLLDNLEKDIRKVNRLMRDIKCKSMPAILSSVDSFALSNDYSTVMVDTF